MRIGDSHITDVDLIRLADGEMPSRTATRIERHLKACRTCRVRMNELERTVARFMTAWQETHDSHFPSPETARARLHGRLHDCLEDEEGPVASRPSAPLRPGLLAARAGLLAGAFAGIALIVLLAWNAAEPGGASAPEVPPVRPDPQLTLGATLGVGLDAVCAPSESHPRVVPAALAEAIFVEYGIRNTGGKAYELDYLIPPELGGSGDIRNLWPQSYSTPVWNAHVKDALEDHLHRLVCGGELSLAAAQIDISEDWIAAYQKHFGTEFPVSDHLAYLKDEPWAE